MRFFSFEIIFQLWILFFWNNILKCTNALKKKSVKYQLEYDRMDLGPSPPTSQTHSSSVKLKTQNLA